MPGAQLGGAVVELDAAREIQPDDPDHVLDLERVREMRVSHMAAGRVVELRLLQVELRGRKPVIGADVVIMHVGQDHVLHRLRIDPDERQRPGRAAQMAAAARCGNLRGEAGVDHHRAVRRDRHPHEVVHRHRAVMRVAADEMIGAPGIALGVADRVELVFGEMGVGVHGGLGRTASGLRKHGGNASLRQPLIAQREEPEP